MKTARIYLLTLFMMSAVACLHAPEKHVVVPTTNETKIAPLIASKAIDDKIRFFNNVLKQNGLSEEDKKIARGLLDTYQNLKKLSSAPPPRNSTAIQDLFNSLGAVDEKYFIRVQKTSQDYSRPMKLFSMKRRNIIDSYLAGNYNEVINLCKELEDVFGPDAITPGIGILYAISLANTQMTEEAIAIGEETARQLETGPDLVQLRTKIAESYLQQMNREKATAIYEKLADTLDEQKIAVQSLSNKIAESENQQEAQTFPEINQLEGTTETSATLSEEPRAAQPEEDQKAFDKADDSAKSVDQILEEVERLLKKNLFSEARDLLISYSGEDISPHQAEELRQALGKVESAENNYLEEKISRISMKKNTEQARRLIDEDRVEEAISKLETPESDQKENREILELKQVAVEKLIDRERNKAAKIFLSAKETQDPVKKEKYLMDAYNILNKLISNYPLSPLNEKLKSNIKKVEDELGKLRRGSATNR